MRVNDGLESQRRSRVATGDYESQRLVASRKWRSRFIMVWLRVVMCWLRVATGLAIVVSAGAVVVSSRDHEVSTRNLSRNRVCVTGFHKSCIDLSVISANSLVSLVTRSINKILNKSIA